MITKINESIVWHDGRPCKVSETPVETSPWKTMAGEILAAHNIPYAAQTTFLGNFKDIHEKAKKAIYTEGPCFLNVLSPCPRGWRYDAKELPNICRAAVETCVWPLYEVVEGEWHLTYEPRKKLPVEEFLKMQGRFAHMFKPGNEWMIEEAQAYVDKQWEKLLAKCK
jgi:pyruvate ferredoxin oxidoreductase beta subunit